MTDAQKEKRRAYNRARMRAWRAANPELSASKSRRNHEKHRESDRARARAWRMENPEKARAKDASRDREKGQVAGRMYRKAGKRLPGVHAARASKVGAPGRFTTAEWLDLVARLGGHCVFPGCRATDVTVDHVIPLRNGGSNMIDNIQPLCGYHNRSKAKRSANYRAALGVAIVASKESK